MPVATVACESRRLDRDHDADASLTDGGQQLLEAGPRDATAGAAEIVIDDGDIAPAELSRAIGKTVLAALTFQVVGRPDRRRLTNVDDGLTGEVLSRDLAHERPPSSRMVGVHVSLLAPSVSASTSRPSIRRTRLLLCARRNLRRLAILLEQVSVAGGVLVA